MASGFTLGPLKDTGTAEDRRGVSPHEILYGKPYESPNSAVGMCIKGKRDLCRYLVSLGRTLTALRSFLVWNRPLILENPVRDFQPGD